MESLKNERIRSIKQSRKIRTDMYPVGLIIWKSLETKVVTVELKGQNAVGWEG